jgi:hypothetical protein
MDRGLILQRPLYPDYSKILLHFNFLPPPDNVFVALGLQRGCVVDPEPDPVGSVTTVILISMIIRNRYFSS